MDLRGHLDLLLLSVLERSDALHGYALIVALREGSDGIFDLPEGTVYPALHRLERDGLISSDWSTESGRRRRAYSLTDDGRRALAARREEWARFARGVEQLSTRPRRRSARVATFALGTVTA
ncbi:MAG TPA: helix-turn-helix transcriptional regulator [Sporichthya sp.]|nr:helix-turn-helix transcriptional regulator [Sporichthya sp.]